MLGSSLSVSCPNYILNTIVAESLRQFADRLEDSKDFAYDLNQLIKETIAKHKRIIFNGNGYTDEWLEEAEKRGLLNLATTPDAIPYYITDQNIALFTRHGIFTEAELRARDAIQYETYSKLIHIEAATMLRMIMQDIIPAVTKYEHELLQNQMMKASLDQGAEHHPLLKELADLNSCLYTKTQELKAALQQMDQQDTKNAALFCKDQIIPLMNQVREYADQLEEITAKQYWPYPDYTDLLYHL